VKTAPIQEVPISAS